MLVPDLKSKIILSFEKNFHGNFILLQKGRNEAMVEVPIKNTIRGPNLSSLARKINNFSFLPEKIESDLSLATRGRFEVIFGPIGLKLGSIALRGTGRTSEESKSA